MKEDTQPHSQYLICEHCTHPNTIKSQYLTFCTRCGKKIAANFSDWSKEHPDQSFADYKLRVCKQSIIHWEVASPLVKQPHKFNVRTLLLILIIPLLGSSAAWGVYHALKTPDTLPDWAKKHMQFGTTELDHWETLRSDKGNFEVRFPGIPEKHADLAGPFGDQLALTTHRYIPGEGSDINLEYVVSYMLFPPDMINSRMISSEQSDDFFDFTLDGFMKKEGGVIKSKLDIVYGLYPGKEVVASTQNGLAEMKCRFYLVENTLYMLHVSSAYQSAGNKAGDVFLNSFKLLVYAQTGP